MCGDISRKKKKQRRNKKLNSVRSLLRSGGSVLSYGSVISHRSILSRRGQKKINKRIGAKSRANVSVKDKSDMLSIFDSVYNK